MVCNTNCVMRRAYDEGAVYFFRSNDDTGVSKGTDWVTLFSSTLALFDPPNLGVVGPDCGQVWCFHLHELVYLHGTPNCVSCGACDCVRGCFVAAILSFVDGVAMMVTALVVISVMRVAVVVVVTSVMMMVVAEVVVVVVVVAMVMMMMMCGGDNSDGGG
jgi:hypothetical protein